MRDLTGSCLLAAAVMVIPSLAVAQAPTPTMPQPVPRSSSTRRNRAVKLLTEPYAASAVSRSG